MDKKNERPNSVKVLKPRVKREKERTMRVGTSAGRQRARMTYFAQANGYAGSRDSDRVKRKVKSRLYQTARHGFHPKGMAARSQLGTRAGPTSTAYMYAWGSVW